MRMTSNAQDANEGAPAGAPCPAERGAEKGELAMKPGQRRQPGEHERTTDEAGRAFPSLPESPRRLPRLHIVCDHPRHRPHV